jgi:transposase-like protein
MTSPKGRDFWERLVREVDAGATHGQVAARHGVSSSSVGNWARKIARAQATPPSAAMVAVRVAAASAARIAITTSSAHLEFEEGVDPTYVAALVRALSSC